MNLKDTVYKVYFGLSFKYLVGKLTGTIRGKRATHRIRKRVMGRWKDKAPKFVRKGNRVIKDTAFEDLFDLPPWLPLEVWLYIQLRGRYSEDLETLSLDHIVPLSAAKSLEDLKKLFSWRNTRLLNKELNQLKSSYTDPENVLLCRRLLGIELDSEPVPTKRSTKSSPKKRRR